MSIRPRISLLLAALLAALSLSAASATYAFASGTIPTNAVGSDISWPQCGGDAPADRYWFAIIGVTGGHPFSANSCFGNQFAWAQATGIPQLYINLDYGLRQDGPLLCSTDDKGCQAYNYGFDSAQWARTYASSQTGGASDALGTWWLDVETENYWSENVDQNTYVIQGALDYLQRIAGRTAGVYSTSYMWGMLAGNFAPPNTPNWVAGANGLDDAGKCQRAFWPGASVWAYQYLNFDINLDQDVGC